jgi:type VI secretion system secreted protein VgrG
MPAFSLDLQAFIRVAIYVFIFFGLYAFWRGRASISASAGLPYFRLRQQRLAAGWRTLFLAIALFGVSAWLAFYGERTAYSIFPVTDTPSLTPTPLASLTPSLTPTETLTPSITPTLQFSLTPSPSAVPVMPPEVSSQFTSAVTPNPNAVFSPLTFARRVNLDTYLAVDAGTVFANPVGSMYATFSYDGMLPGVQWTALWYRGAELVHFETIPWDGGTGGYGFSEWIPDAEEWLPSTYQVQIFVGSEVKVVGSFEVTGAPATSSPTPTASSTATATASKTSTPTITATHTRQPTATSGE